MDFNNRFRTLRRRPNLPTIITPHRQRLLLLTFNAQNLLAKVPAEIWFDIFQYLSHFTLAHSVKHVNRRLHSLVNAINPRLCGLTSQIWVKIMADPALDYHDLRRLSITCSSLRELFKVVKPSYLSEQSFRLPLASRKGGLQYRIPGGTFISFHPVLCFLYATVDGIVWANDRYDPGKRINLDTVLSENATIPAMRSLKMFPRSSSCFDIMPFDDNGQPVAINIRHVLDALSIPSYNTSYELVPIEHALPNQPSYTWLPRRIEILRTICEDGKFGGLDVYLAYDPNITRWYLGVKGQFETAEDVEKVDDPREQFVRFVWKPHPRTYRPYPFFQSDQPYDRQACQFLLGCSDLPY